MRTALHCDDGMEWDGMGWGCYNANWSSFLGEEGWMAMIMTTMTSFLLRIMPDPMSREDEREGGRNRNRKRRANRDLDDWTRRTFVGEGALSKPWRAAFCVGAQHLYSM